MQAYKAPLRDMRFVLHELHGNLTLAGGSQGALETEAAFPPDLLDSILEEAAKLAETVLLPLNQSGDAVGCTLENGVVRTPPGFRDAYRRFREGGWQAIAGDPRWGGQGLPESVNKLVEEMLCSSNLSFSLYSILTHSACMAIQHHANDELRERYLPKMIEGSWSGTMCLTEPQAGTDLALLRTRATPHDDGTWRIDGAKIFITAGEHDLTENIVHLVLARLPDAPPGVKGISLFLVPKFIPADDGRPGRRNGVTCTAIEHKMGIKASATCQLLFDDATGWLIGAPHKGLRAMFTMMNSARLSVGIEGIGISEAAYQGAVSYARDRLQGGAGPGPQSILMHPDIRRMLLTMRAHAEGGRMLGVWLACQLDIMASEADGETRAEAGDLAALLTPVVKSLCTDQGFESASLGVQVYGGHGYIRDHGMEQHVRDARIAMLYEGTNGVQAMDLVGRKLPMLPRFFAIVTKFIAAHGDDTTLAVYVRPLADALTRLQDATSRLIDASRHDPSEAGAAAADYLKLFGLTAQAFMWARTALIARQAPDDAFYRTKLATARFFMERILPQTTALQAAIAAGGESMMAFEDAAF